MTHERSVTIAGRLITDRSPAYVIAECSHNHQGSVQLAADMFRVAKDCGADAVKLQKRSPAFYATLRAKGLTDYADLREGRELDRGAYLTLRDRAHDLGLAFIVTAFDTESASVAYSLGVDAIKIPSGAIHDPDLLSHVSTCVAPVILSTGCAWENDVANAVATVERFKTRCALLQCTSSYPCADEHMHLRTIATYRRDYPSTIIGLSSHHFSNLLEPVAYALGARIFEKHFTLSRALGAGDHANSLEPEGLCELVANLRSVEVAMGDGIKRFLPCEEMGRKRLDVHYNPAAEVAQPMEV